MLSAQHNDPWSGYIQQTRRAAADGVVVQFVLNTVQRKQGLARTLDLGCGGGRHLRYMLEQGCKAHGMDSCAEATRSKDLLVLKHDVTAPLPLLGDLFDLVLLWGTFVHLPRDSHSAVFAEIFRVLAPSGLLLIDYLRPDDFRRAIGTPITDNYTRSPWLEGVTDYFCVGDEILRLARPLVEVQSGDLSYTGRDGQRISQGYFGLQKPSAG